MRAKSYLKGHEIEFVNNDWIYIDTKKSVSKTHKHRSCNNCNKHQTKEGHDSCLGKLIGLMNACCGHGRGKGAYVQFIDGESIHGKDATLIINILKKHSNK